MKPASFGYGLRGILMTGNSCPSNGCSVVPRELLSLGDELSRNPLALEVWVDAQVLEPGLMTPDHTHVHRANRPVICCDDEGMTGLLRPCLPLFRGGGSSSDDPGKFGKIWFASAHNERHRRS
jgi:hypothetical protein